MLFKKNWNIEEMTGYAPITTFYMDFSIADRFGISAIKDTYKRGLETARFLGYKEFTEFIVVLNWKIFEHCRDDEAYAELYDELWRKTDDLARETLQGEELMYYYRTTD